MVLYHIDLSDSLKCTAMNFWLQTPSTVVCISESQWPDLWSKWHIFDPVFYNIEMPSCSGLLGSTLLLTGDLKWGTVWTST